MYGDSLYSANMIHHGKHWGIAMAAPVRVREDYSALELRRLARGSSDANQCRRLLALAAILEGCSRTEAARIGGVGLQIVRDWVIRFNMSGPDELIDRKAPGKPPKLTPDQQADLAKRVEAGPIACVDGVVRWRCSDLVAWTFEEFGVSMDETTMGRLLKRLGFSHMSARPQNPAQNPRVLEAFKKTFPPGWKRSGQPCRRARP